MKAIFIFILSLFAVVAFSVSSLAQNFSSVEGQAVDSYGQLPIPEMGGTTITHSIDPVTIIPGNSVACAIADTTYDNQYWRSFLLKDFGISPEFSVSMVDIGIENATSVGTIAPQTTEERYVGAVCPVALEPMKNE